MTTKDDIEELFKTHYAAMYRLSMLIIRDDNVSRDIVHDIFEALLVSGRSDVSDNYLLAAVRNRCLKYIRSLSAHDRMKAVYSIDENEIEDEEWPDDETIAMIQSTVSNDLYFRWNQAHSIEETVERLNNFEQIHLTFKDKNIKVD